MTYRVIINIERDFKHRKKEKPLCQEGSRKAVRGAGYFLGGTKCAKVQKPRVWPPGARSHLLHARGCHSTDEETEVHRENKYLVQDHKLKG